MYIKKDKYFNWKKFFYLVFLTANKNIHTPTHENKNIEIGTIRENEIYVGFGHWMKKTAFDETQIAKKPSLFVITLTYGMWTTRKLADRVVREQAGINRPCLMPTKKNAITQAFNK